MVNELTEENSFSCISEMTNNSSPLNVLYFTATWCGPCKTIKPLVETAWEQIKGQFDMIIVDADEGSDICSFLKVRGFPTLVSFINKEMVESVQGADIAGVKHFFQSSYNRVLS